MYFNSFSNVQPSFKARVDFNLSNDDKKEIHRVISQDKELEPIGRGSLGVVYKYYMNGMPLAIKTYKNSTTEKDRKPSAEADVLEKIASECKRTQQLVDEFNIDNQEYLVTSFINGNCLAEVHDDITDGQFENILDELFKYEKNGMVFYDFNPANIKYDGDEVGFYDFECYAQQDPDKLYPEYKSDTNHFSRNVYRLGKTNPAAFEIRTVGKVLGYLERPDVENGPERAYDFTKRYLQALSKFCDRSAAMYENTISDEVEDKDKIVNYEKTLARLFKEPDDDIIETEKQLMRLRELTTEFYFRHDANLPQDDVLYQNASLYTEVLEERFSLLEDMLDELENDSDEDKRDYAIATRMYLENMKNCWLNQDYEGFNKNMN